jgi:hypothetical protein
MSVRSACRHSGGRLHAIADVTGLAVIPRIAELVLTAQGQPDLGPATPLSEDFQGGTISSRCHRDQGDAQDPAAPAFTSTEPGAGTTPERPSHIKENA